MAHGWTPPLYVREVGGRCRLFLGGYLYGEGTTLQGAGDDLVYRLLNLAMEFRASSGPRSLGTPPPDVRWFGFLRTVAGIASRGEDVRDWIFGRRALGAGSA